MTKKINMHISRNFEAYDYLVTLIVLYNFVMTQSIIQLFTDFSIDDSCLFVFSGGRRLHVTGRNMNAIQSPKIYVRNIQNGRRSSSEVWQTLCVQRIFKVKVVFFKLNQVFRKQI